MAVSFSRTNPAAMELIEYVEMPGARRWRTRQYVTANEAFDRVLHCFTKLTEAFPDDSDVRKAHTLMERVRPILSGESMRIVYLKFANAGLGPQDTDWFLEYRRGADFTQDMTDNQVITAMEVFNRYRPLSDDEVGLLRPVMQNVVWGAPAGVYSVATDLDLHLPAEKVSTELKGDSPVYLRDPWTD